MISIRLDEDDLDRLDGMAAAVGMNRTEVIQNLIRACEKTWGRDFDVNGFLAIANEMKWRKEYFEDMRSK